MVNNSRMKWARKDKYFLKTFLDSKVDGIGEEIISNILESYDSLEDIEKNLESLTDIRKVGNIKAQNIKEAVNEIDYDEVFHNFIPQLVENIRSKETPAPKSIVMEAFQNTGLYNVNEEPQVSAEKVKEDFNDYLEEVFEETLKVLEKYESITYQKVLERIPETDPKTIESALESFREHKDNFQKLKEALKEILPKWENQLWKVFQSKGQSRKVRGGTDWEYQIANLLNLLGADYDKHKARYRMDFMLPSEDFFKEYRQRSFVISAKRTLRERWQEVVEELQSYNAPNIYLATAEEKDNISRDKAKQIAEEYNIHLIVWNNVKEEKFRDMPSVKGFNQLAEEILDFKDQYWTEKS